MAQQLRWIGYVMMVLGLIVLLAYVVDPLMLVWRVFRSMPLPVQAGLGVAGVGLTILVSSLLLEKRRDDRAEHFSSSE